MAAVIFHGPPGSYKTSSAIWFEMLTALRAGRIVLTNIEGMKPIDEIEKELGEQFPESADIWRLSTQKKKGLELFRSFFHWAPIGAQIIIDEVQDVFPAERSFKVEAYDYQPISLYKAHLPEAWFNRHFELLDDIKPDDLSSADSDDLGEVIFDENGHIIYPTTLKESFMRHRKYNWDIVVCTPDITQVNTLIRGACEAGFNHMSKDSIGKVIPYFKRRPRIRQHPPKENGMQAKKADIITYRKVPTDVHKLYKSTSTGKITASGVGKSPLQSGGFLAGVTLLVCIVIFYALYFGGAFQASKDTLAVSAGTNQTGSSLGPASRASNTGTDSHHGGSKTAVSADVFLKLPYEPKEVYLVATNMVYENGIFSGVQMTFEMVTKSGKMFVDETKIKHFGVIAKYVTDCTANLIYGDSIKTVYCKPTDDSEYQPIVNQQVTREISLL